MSSRIKRLDGFVLCAKCRLRTADRVQNADWEFVLFFRLIRDNMASYNLPSVTQVLYNFLRSSFAIICTIVEYSLPVSWSQSFLIFFKPRLVFSFSARVGWRDVFTEFTNLLKVDVDVNGCHYWIFNLCNVREIHLFNRYVFILLTKMRTKTRTFLSTWYIFNF